MASKEHFKYHKDKHDLALNDSADVYSNFSLNKNHKHTTAFDQKSSKSSEIGNREKSNYAYENFIETQASDFLDGKKLTKKGKTITASKDTKQHSIFAGSSFNDLLEFPRQQENDPPKSEVQQFSASQKLFRPTQEPFMPSVIPQSVVIAENSQAVYEQLSGAGSILWKAASSYAGSLMSPSVSSPTPHCYLYDSSSTMENSSHKEIYYVNFNQDASSLAVCHEGGYHLYNMGSIEHTNGTGLEPAHHSNIPEKTAIVERLFQSSLITLVSLNHSRKLQVFHFQKGTEICSHSYTSAIKAVRMNRKRVIVCLEESVHVHNIRDMRLMHMIRDTPTNREGLIDLCSSDHSCYLAYPGSATHGHVNIFDADPLVATCTIAAHDAPLAAIRFNADGNKLATASVKGTVIRIFAIPSGERLYEFTRGMKRCVQIHSLAFSADSKYLCSSSNTETVHIFSLARAEEQKQQTQNTRTEETDQSITSWVNYFSQQASNYLPQQMNELMLREKSYATARLPIVGTKTCCAMPRIANRDYLAVASTDGYLFCYSLPQEPGECTLARQYRIGPLAEEKEVDSEGRVTASGTATATPPQAIYPPIPQHPGDDMAPIGLGTSPKNTPPMHTTPSPPLNASPLSSSPIVSSPIKTRRKTISQSSSSNAVPIIGTGTSPASIPFSSSPIKTMQPQPMKLQQAQHQKGKTAIRRISSHSSSSESSSESIERRSNDSSDIEKNAKNDTMLDLNNPDDFPPLDNFD